MVLASLIPGILNNPKGRSRDPLPCTLLLSGGWWLSQVEFDLGKDRNGAFPDTP